MGDRSEPVECSVLPVMLHLPRRAWKNRGSWGSRGKEVTNWTDGRSRTCCSKNE